MKQKIEDIRALLERWYEAQTTDAEERELRTWFCEAQELPADLERERVMFAGFEMLAAGESPRRGRRPMMRAMVWAAAAAAAAAVFTGVILTVAYIQRPYGYINGHAVRDAEVAMQTMVYLEKLEAFDRSMRIFEEQSAETFK